MQAICEWQGYITPKIAPNNFIFSHRVQKILKFTVSKQRFNCKLQG